MTKRGYRGTTAQSEGCCVKTLPCMELMDRKATAMHKGHNEERRNQNELHRQRSRGYDLIKFIFIVFSCVVSARMKLEEKRTADLQCDKMVAKTYTCVLQLRIICKKLSCAFSPSWPHSLFLCFVIMSLFAGNF